MNKFEIISMMRTWFRHISDHEPVQKLIPMLDLKNLKMKFPEATLTTTEQFAGWYATVSEKFFNVEHILKQVDIKISGDKAEVFLVVNWKAETREPLQALSTKIDCDAYQEWIVVKGSDGKPKISSYDVLGIIDN